MLIVTLPCIIPFVDVKCSTVAWHTVHKEMRKRSTESARIPQHSGSCVIKGVGGSEMYIVLTKFFLVAIRVYGA